MNGMVTEPVSVRRPSMTILSRLHLLFPLPWALLRALVWSSQFASAVVVSALLQGCLFPAPPTWDSKPTRPQLFDPTPATTQFVVISTDGTASNHTVTFAVSELSEDEGHALRAIWYLNYGLPNVTYINSRDIPPGHLDISHPKEISVVYTPTQKNAMCVPFTLLVMHIENDSNLENHYPIDDSDVATVTWWLSITNSISGDLALSDCLTSAGASP